MPPDREMVAVELWEYAQELQGVVDEKASMLWWLQEDGDTSPCPDDVDVAGSTQKAQKRLSEALLKLHFLIERFEKDRKVPEVFTPRPPLPESPLDDIPF